MPQIKEPATKNAMRIIPKRALEEITESRLSTKNRIGNKIARALTLREQVERGIRGSRQKSETLQTVERLLRNKKMSVEQLVENGVSLRKAMYIIRAQNAIKELMNPAFYNESEYNKGARVLGVVLYGSVLKDTETVNDIDLFVFTTKRPIPMYNEEEERINSIMETGDDKGSKISLSVIDVMTDRYPKDMRTVKKMDISDIRKALFALPDSGIGVRNGDPALKIPKVLFGGENIIYTRSGVLGEMLNAVRKKPSEYIGRQDIEDRTRSLKYVLKGCLKSVTDVKIFQKSMISLADAMIKDSEPGISDRELTVSLMKRLREMADKTPDRAMTKRRMISALATTTQDIRNIQGVTKNKRRIYNILKDIVEHAGNFYLERTILREPLDE